MDSLDVRFLGLMEEAGVRAVPSVGLLEDFRRLRAEGRFGEGAVEEPLAGRGVTLWSDSVKDLPKLREKARKLGARKASVAKVKPYASKKAKAGKGPGAGNGVARECPGCLAMKKPQAFRKSEFCTACVRAGLGGVALQEATGARGSAALAGAAKDSTVQVTEKNFALRSRLRESADRVGVKVRAVVLDDLEPLPPGKPGTVVEKMQEEKRRKLGRPSRAEREAEGAE